MKKFLYLTSLALALAGCIYPFDAEVATEDSGGLVVEGDILIGDLARVSLSCVRPLRRPSGEFRSPFRRES